MKKGFTLIELLAVIVILAIIALIAAPIILNIIDGTQKSSNERSIDMYAKAAENAIAKYEMQNNGQAPTSFDDIKDLIEYDGTTISCTTQLINTDGTIYLEGCTIGNTKVEGYTYGTIKDVTVTPEVEKICEIQRQDSTKYSVGDVVTCNIEETPDEFYVIAEAELTASTIQMLTKNNIHTTEYRQREAAGTIEFLNANNVVDNYVQYLNTKLPGATGELLTYDQAINLGCIDDNRACGPDANGGANAPTWVYSTDYWMGTVSGNHTWFIFTEGSFNYGPYTEANYGVRPVITVPTDYIK